MKALSYYEKEYVKFPLCPEIITIESEFTLKKNKTLEVSMKFHAVLLRK